MESMKQYLIIQIKPKKFSKESPFFNIKPSNPCVIWKFLLISGWGVFAEEIS